MSKNQAINALSLGKKVSHRYFSSDEYIYVDDNCYLLDEKGNIMGDAFWQFRTGDAWEKDWFVINDW